MATLNSPRNEQLVENVVQLAERRVPNAECEQLIPFVESFLDTCAIEEMHKRDPQDAYATTYQLWRFIQSFADSYAKIRLFNPVFEQHGWQSQRSVLSVLVPDTPFVIDSIRIELNRRGIAIHNIHSAVLTIARNNDGKLQGVQSKRNKLQRDTDTRLSDEALVFMEVTRQSDSSIFELLEQSLQSILLEVSSVVSDFQPMRDMALTLAKQLPVEPAAVAAQDSVSNTDARDFLSWLCDDHFTFLGYQNYALDDTLPTQEQLTRDGMGVFSTNCEKYADDIQREIRQRMQAVTDIEPPLSFSKSAVRSRVHRYAYPDFVTVRIPDVTSGTLVEHRFLGLYTSKAYSALPCSVPIWRDKVAAVERASGLDMHGHDGKELRQIINTFPRDEIVHSTVEQLLDTIVGVWRIQERRKVRLFMRPDEFGKFVSVMVYTPRDMYNTEVRARIEEIIWDELRAEDADFTTYFSESVLTRTHFVFRVNADWPQLPNMVELRERVVQSAQKWSDRLETALLDELGEEQGGLLASRYDNAFPAGYQDDFDPRSAIGDIQKIDCLSAENTLEMKVYRVPEEPDHMLHFRLYHAEQPLALSDLLPPLENMGVHVRGDRSYMIHLRDGRRIWMHDFSLSYSLATEIDLDSAREKFQQAFRRVWEGDAESDAFNKLLLGTQLDWRQIAVLRAYAHYMRQIGFNARDGYIAETLGKYLALTDTLVDLFTCRFQPEQLPGEQAAGSSPRSMVREQQVLAQLQEQIDAVDNLNEDSIFRQYLALINATVRTNYFQTDSNGELKPYFSFKLLPSMLPDIPAPVPEYEIFVYSPKVEGVHLRGGKVARGGLRWSDRPEDFRTEVLGLVKAQQVKNSVIVPVGAKGGFVVKTNTSDMSREEVQEHGISAYKTFISGLLDLTDNIIDGDVVAPTGVVRHDEEDPYLVVAADKGTATFSDIANQISADYGFWLGDAFASGGSNGYDHKRMGITAKGAWVSVQRHFRERGIDIQSTDFSVVGIGDMMGDVFGNGMLLSEHICLKAAFNHQHIFIDPTPDAASSYAERERLFALPRSSWSDYEEALISKGGGIFERSAKSISISPEMQQAFAITQERLAPDALIKALLQSSVDLLWNGGIGTYIKAVSESHADVGDKANDSVRIDAPQLNCQVIGEGGNLGITQLARAEFALLGGAINTDFIDNAAGVDCSDHEVNIKILLNEVVRDGDLTDKQRSELLEAMTDEVGELVLRNNYVQTQAISIAASEANHRSGEYRRLIGQMEESGSLDRALEFLPTEEVLLERDAQGKQLSRPELSVLISYTKSQLKEELMCESVCNNPYVAEIIHTAFPHTLTERFAERIDTHQLRCEIIATQLANDMVNHMGITFLSRMMQAPGVGSNDVALAYMLGRDVFSVPKYWRMIEQLDHKVDANLQLSLMSDLIRLMRRASHWFIRNQRANLGATEQLVNRFQPSVLAFVESPKDFLNGAMRDAWEQRREELLAAGVPEELSDFIAAAPSLYSALSITDAAEAADQPASLVADAFFKLGDKLDLHWYQRQISSLPVKTQWQALAREAYRDDLEAQLASITSSMLAAMHSSNDDLYTQPADGASGSAPDSDAGRPFSVEQCVNEWLEGSELVIGRWQTLIAEVRAANANDFSVYTVANRVLTDLAEHCRPDQAA